MCSHSPHPHLHSQESSDESSDEDDFPKSKDPEVEAKAKDAFDAVPRPRVPLLEDEAAFEKVKTVSGLV